MKDLPPFLTDLINSPPPAGTGVHKWLFNVARNLHAHLTATEIVDLLTRQTRSCGREVSPREILCAVRDSIGAAWQPHSPPSSPKWPAPNLQYIASICADSHGQADLFDYSPVQFGDEQPHTEEVIDVLFPGDPLLCCGKSQSSFATRPRSQWRSCLQRMALIVPSPMKALTGITKEGKRSAHSLDNTGPRRFLVVECDFAALSRDGHRRTPFAPLMQELSSRNFTGPDMAAAVLLYLSRFAPLVCAVHSGHKSVHGWFFVAEQADSTVLNFFQSACQLGADPATFLPSQFVRVPDGTRDDGKRQTLLYFNPSLIPRP